MKRPILLSLVLALVVVSTSWALTAREMIAAADRQMRGRTSESEMEMSIITPEWRRSMRMHSWEDVDGDKAFVRVTEPAKDRGTATLKLGSEIWTWLPSIERSMKIPPSMMQQGWMGSDFTNDDMVKSSSIVEDYTHELTDTVEIAGETVYVITMIPKEEAAVVWGKILYYARFNDYLPVREEFYDEDDQLVRRMDVGEFRTMGGRVIPTLMTLTPLTEDKEGHQTIVRWLSLRFDVSIPGGVFTRANLERAR